jgi:hypothetical protein
VRVVHALLLPTLVAGALAASVGVSSGAPIALHASVSGVRPAARAAATLTVTTQGRVGVPKVSPRLDGANPRWPGGANGILTTDGTGLNPRTRTLMKVLGLRSLRYPGGTVSNLFDYRRFDSDPATGPQCQTSGGFARPTFSPVEDSHYSPALNAQFTGEVGAVTNLMLPMINTTPGLARGFVSTVRQGQQAPLYVEVGNEPYLPDQRYWRSSNATTRLHQYLAGGTAHQPSCTGEYAGNTGLFRVRGCHLKDPVQCVAVRRLSGGLGTNDAPSAGTGLPATAHLAAATWKAGTGYRPAFPNHSVTSLTVRPKGSSACRAPSAW